MEFAWISGHWDQLGTIVAFIVWLIRMEGKVLNSEKRITHIENQVDNIESGLSKELSEVKQSLARIEGYLKARCDSGDCMPPMGKI